MRELSGRVALVTGASRGLGYLLARELGRHGCRVMICARDPEELERARQELERDGVEVSATPCDVADRAQVERLVEATVARYGALDVLVNNAGAISVGPVDTMTVTDFEDAMGVMFWGTVHTTLAGLPHLRRQRGRVVNITSIGGKVSSPHLLPYNCAKFAAVGFSEGLTAELARDGVAVTTVVPGLMRTGSPLNALFKGKAEREFAWFTIGDSLPGISMDAERAAQRIVRAARRGTPEVILTLPAKVAVRVHGVAPGTTTRVLGVVNRLLPTAGAPPHPAGAGAEAAAWGAVRGSDAYRAIRRPAFDRLVRPTLRAARRFAEIPGPTALPPEAMTSSEKSSEEARTSDPSRGLSSGSGNETDDYDGMPTYGGQR